MGLADVFGDSLLNDELLTMLHRNAARQSGFTQACRRALMESPIPLSACQFCAELRRKFPRALKRHRNPLASVTTVLTRLVEYGEARTFLNQDGRRLWEWVTEKHANVLEALQQPVNFSRLTS
jgi:hypothetical protein